MGLTFKQRADYISQRGVPVVPALPGTKRSHITGWPQLATTSPERIEEWNQQNANFNCVSVPKPGTVWIADIDHVEVLDNLPQPLPPTLKVRTPSGGLHVYFKQTPESEAMGNRDVVRIGDFEHLDDEGRPEPLFEAKVNNKTAASPGSVTATGMYKVIDKSPIAAAPQWLIDWVIENSRSKKSLIPASTSPRPLHPSFDPQDFYDHYEQLGAFSIERSVPKNGFEIDIPSIGCIVKGDFHTQSTETGFVRSEDGFGYCCFAGGCENPTLEDVIDKLEEEGYERFPYYIYEDEDDDILFNDPRFPVEFVSGEPDTTADTTAPTAVAENAAAYNFRFSDTGNAERLVRRFGTRIRYVRDAGEWRVWNGKAWLADKTGKVDRCAKKVAQEIFAEAETIEDEDEREATFKWAIKSESRERRNAMIDLAAKERGVVSLIEDYDRGEWLFNVQNGTIDLKTGELLPHDPANMMTKISPVAYDPEAKCPLWQQFLHRVQDNDAEMVDFLARAVGYTLTGDTAIQALFFMHGDGCNGKGVFANVIRHLMGSYAENASFDTFVVQQNDGRIRNDLAKLVGARIVTASESQDGQRLDESLIKSLTGQDPITARFLHKEFFTFYPQFKLWMSSNYQPAIRNQDWGIWRRVKMIPFTVTIPDEERDEMLTEKLKAELPGILNWALQGLAVYRDYGMMYPDKVNAATQQYRESQDIVGQFLKAKCIENPVASIRASDLYDLYKGWAADAKEYIMKERKFGEAMKKRGFRTEHKRDGNHYMGLGRLATEHMLSVEDAY